MLTQQFFVFTKNIKCSEWKLCVNILAFIISVIKCMLKIELWSTTMPCVFRAGFPTAAAAVHRFQSRGREGPCIGSGKQEEGRVAWPDCVQLTVWQDRCSGLHQLCPRPPQFFREVCFTFIFFFFAVNKKKKKTNRSYTIAGCCI